MLNLTRKTPSKLDDFFILFVGVALVVVPFLRITGLITVRFEVMEVLIGATLPILAVLGKWVYYVFKVRRANAGEKIAMPDTASILVVALAIFHIMPMWRVDLKTWYAMFVENTGFTNIWLVIMTYCSVSVILGRYVWPMEFVNLIFGIGSKVVESRTKPALPHDPDPGYADLSAETPDGYPVIGTPILEEPAIPLERMPTQMPYQEPQTVRPVSELDEMPQALPAPEDNVPPRPGITALMPSVRAYITPKDMIDGAVAGNPDAAMKILEKLGHLNRTMMEDKMIGAIPGNIIPRIFAAIDNGQPQDLIAIMQHPAFAVKQRPVFEELLSR